MISRYVFWYHWIAQTLLPLMERVRFFKKSNSWQIFDYLGLCCSSFRCEQTSAQGATAAHFVAPEMERQRNGVQIWLQRHNKGSFYGERPQLLHVSKFGLYNSHTAAHFWWLISISSVCAIKTITYMSPGAGVKWAVAAPWAEICSQGKLLPPMPELSKIQHEIDFIL
jgi:hypothetical protein